MKKNRWSSLHHTVLWVLATSPFVFLVGVAHNTRLPVAGNWNQGSNPASPCVTPAAFG